MLNPPLENLKDRITQIMGPTLHLLYLSSALASLSFSPPLSLLLACTSALTRQILPFKLRAYSAPVEVNQPESFWLFNWCSKVQEDVMQLEMFCD